MLIPTEMTIFHYTKIKLGIQGTIIDMYHALSTKVNNFKEQNIKSIFHFLVTGTQRHFP